jgi:hypothetical protein
MRSHLYVLLCTVHVTKPVGHEEQLQYKCNSSSGSGSSSKGILVIMSTRMPHSAAWPMLLGQSHIGYALKRRCSAMGTPR